MLNIYVLDSYQLKELPTVIQLMMRNLRILQGLHCMVHKGKGNKNQKLKSNQKWGAILASNFLIQNKR